MLMSPDSSGNPDPRTQPQPQQPQQPQSVIRIQVPECTQSHPAQPQNQPIFAEPSAAAQRSNYQTSVIFLNKSIPKSNFLSKSLNHESSPSLSSSSSSKLNQPGSLVTPSKMSVYQQNTQTQQQQYQQHQQPPPSQRSDLSNIQTQQRSETPEYTKSFPVMDTTVASSMKGEPELHIGMFFQ